jgi:hypothetical protein
VSVRSHGAVSVSAEVSMSLTEPRQASAKTRHLVSVSQPPDDQPPHQRRGVDAFIESLGRLVVSDEPAVVLSSLAQLSVATYCDECIIDIVRDGQPRYRVRYPVDMSDPTDSRDVSIAPRGRTVHTIVERDHVDVGPPYTGSIAHICHAHVPNPYDTVLVRLSVERAIAVITRERLATANERAHTEAANLKIALERSRTIGAAVGILMAARRITYSAAFQALTSTSQRLNRKLHDVAEDVLLTGALDLET